MVTEEDIARLIKVHEEEDYLVCEVGHGASRVQGVLVYRRVLGRHYCLQGHRLYPF